MKCRKLMLKTLIVVVFAVLASVELAAQHARYKLVDLGTFGGPTSVIAPTDFGGPENPGRGLTSDGVIVGTAETTMPDPFAPNYCNEGDCLVAHAFAWKHGVLTDLGTTQGPNSDLNSVAHWINDRGWIVGSSQVGGFDSLSNIPANHAT